MREAHAGRRTELSYGSAMAIGNDELDETRLSHRFLEANGVRLHYVEAGTGPLVVLLHGFPEFWYCFRRQIPALVAAGFRVLAPDLRGYNLSSKPPSTSDYGMRLLVEDVAALIAAAGERSASVIGHDWGGGIAWAFAMQHSAMVERLVILNCPHPERFARGLLHPEQLLRSSYVFFFQLPALPEKVARRAGYARLLDAMRKELVPPFQFTPAEYARYIEAYAQPGAIKAMIDYYRAMLRPASRVELRVIDAPVLVLWGVRDVHLRQDLATPTPRLVPNARVEFFTEASHWLHHERAAQVNQRLLAFLRRGEA